MILLEEHYSIPTSFYSYNYSNPSIMQNIADCKNRKPPGEMQPPLTLIKPKHPPFPTAYNYTLQYI